MIFLLILILLFLLIDLKINKKIYTPSVIFNGIFFITLFLYNLRLSYLQQELLPKTILIFYVCVFSYNLPCICTYFFKPVIRHSKQKIYKFRFSNLKMLIAISILFLILILYSKGFPLLWKITGSEKTYFDFGIPSVTGVFYALVIITGAYSLNNKGIYKYIYLLFGLLLISRQLIIAMILEAFIIKLLMKKGKINYILIIGLATICILGFSVIGNMRTGESSFLRVAKFKNEYDWIPTSLKWIYSYMCFSISNLNNLVSMTDGAVNYGATCFCDLVPTILTDLFNVKLNFNELYLVSINFTVSTFIPPLYLDFGIVGIFIFCLSLGIIVNRVYYRVNRYPNLVNQLVYAILMHNILMLFFSNMFLYLPVIGQLFFIPILFKKERLSYENISYRS